MQLLLTVSHLEIFSWWMEDAIYPVNMGSLLRNKWGRDVGKIMGALLTLLCLTHVFRILFYLEFYRY